MNEYEDLIETLVGMAKVTRPPLNLPETRDSKIQHGICDLLEDAAVAVDDLLSRLKGANNEEEWPHAKAA
jgi:hypothetical protein